MRKLFTLLCAFFTMSAGAQTLEEAWPEVDGPVYAILKDTQSNTLYIGGDFQSIGTPTQEFAVLDSTTANPDIAFLNIKGVSAALPDGNGGWYLGGDFTNVKGVARNRLARIDATGVISSWNPNADGEIWEIAVSGNTVFVAGSFTQIGGQARNGLAAIDAASGVVSSWNPAPNGSVEHIVINGSTLFVAGTFQTIGGQTRNKLAQLDMTTGNATTFDANMGPAFTTPIRDMVVNGNTLYIGGIFTYINGTLRPNFAAIDITTALLTSFDPAPDGHVNALALQGSTLYIGGDFSTVGGLSRPRIASLNIGTNTLNSWSISMSGSVSALGLYGNTLYAGGAFSVQGHNYIMALDATNAQVLPWNPNADAVVDYILSRGDKILVAGNFSGIGDRKDRAGLAAIDCATGKVKDWDPGLSVSAVVYSLAKNGSSIYIGGDFMSIGGKPRNSIGAVDAVSGAVTTFRPSTVTLPVRVMAMTFYNGMVYAAGEFAEWDGLQRKGIANFDPSSSLCLSFDAKANDFVYTMEFRGNNVYAGGNFNTIGGQPRNNLAAIDLGTSKATAWDPHPLTGSTNTVKDLLQFGDRMYVAGTYSSIGGLQRTSLTPVDINTGVAEPGWNANMSGATVNTMARAGTYLFVGGDFTLAGSVPSVNLGYVNAYNGAAGSWNPNMNASSEINTLVTDPERLYVGGDFSEISNTSRKNFAAYKLPPGTGIDNKTVVNNTPSFTLYPNPAMGGKFHCKFTSLKQQQLRLVIADVTGKVLHTQATDAKQGANNVPVAVNAAGMQLLVVSLKGEGVEYATQKLVVE